MSSAISAVSRSRSSRLIAVSPTRSWRISVSTRCRSSSASSVTLKICGPSAPITCRCTEFFSSANGSPFGPGAVPAAAVQTLVQIHLAPPPEHEPAPAGQACLGRRAHGFRRASERGFGTRCWPRTSGFAVTMGTPSLTASEISRSLGTYTSGSRPSTAITSVTEMPTRLWARLSTSRVLAGIEAHQRSVSRPELGVLERERVEHADHDQAGRRVDRHDHLGREPGRRVDDDEVVRLPEQGVGLSDQLRL